MKIARNITLILLIVLALLDLLLLLFFPVKYKDEVETFSNKYGVEQALVYSVIKAESNFNKEAISRCGACGLMQLMPETAEWVASKLAASYSYESLFNPHTNIEYGVYYLKYLLNKYNDTITALACYNAGETAARNWTNSDNKVEISKITYPETKNYVKKALMYYMVYIISK